MSFGKQVSTGYKKFLKKIAKERGLDPKLVDQGKIYIDHNGGFIVQTRNVASKVEKPDD